MTENGAKRKYENRAKNDMTRERKNGTRKER